MGGHAQLASHLTEEVACCECRVLRSKLSLSAARRYDWLLKIRQKSHHKIAQLVARGLAQKAATYRREFLDEAMARKLNPSP